MSAAVITAPTCRFKTKRRGVHIGIARADICGDCLAAMQAALVGGGPAFCFECGWNPKPGDLLGYFYRDTGAMWMCEPCSLKQGAKLTSEIDAKAAERQALIITSVQARHEIMTAPTLEQKMTLWQKWRMVVGPRRKV